MIKSFTYTDEQWDPIRTVVRDELGLEADQIQIPTPRYREKNVYVMYSLRGRMEAAAAMYVVHRAAKRQTLSRDELVALRQKAENWRAEINDALAVPIPSKHFIATILLPGVDVSMPTETDNYFRKLARNLDRQIEQAGQRSDNARKTDRDHCWNELLAIWLELGGKETGKSAARFLEAASKPVMGSAVPDIASIVQWLERRKKKPANRCGGVGPPGKR